MRSRQEPLIQPIHPVRKLHDTSCADRHRNLIAAIHVVARGAIIHEANLPWGIDGIAGGFTRGAIQDMLVDGLLVPGNMHDRPIGVATFLRLQEG